MHFKLFGPSTTFGKNKYFIFILEDATLPLNETDVMIRKPEYYWQVNIEFPTYAFTKQAYFYKAE